MRVLKVVVSFSMILAYSILSVDCVAAQTIDIREGSDRDIQGREQPAAHVCVESSIAGIGTSCFRLRLDSPENVFLFLEMQRLSAIQSATSETSGRLQGVDEKIVILSGKIDALAASIETSYNTQLSTIRDHIVAKLETLPLRMIDDEAVVREIRSLVVEEVEAAFDKREQ